jgi:surfeit locus 1 family protein
MEDLAMSLSRSTPWRRWVVLLAAVLGVVITARLGVWQLARAEQKETLQAALDRRGELPPLDTAALTADAAQAGEQQHRLVRVRGRWLAEHTVFLDNRQMNGRPGFFVLTPLQLEGRPQALLVQRGWVPRDNNERTRLPELPLAPGVVELVGRLAPPPARLYELGEGETGRIRQNLDLGAFAGETGLRLLPLSLLQTQAEGPSGDGLLREWARPAADVHKHYGYAFQWFALASLIAGLYVWFQLVRPRVRRSQ